MIRVLSIFYDFPSDMYKKYHPFWIFISLLSLLLLFDYIYYFDGVGVYPLVVFLVTEGRGLGLVGVGFLLI